MRLYGECDSSHIISYNQVILPVFSFFFSDDCINSVQMILQERLIQGTDFVHETLGAYKTLEELWDGEL